MADPFGNGSGRGRPPDDPLAEIRDVVDSLRKRLWGGSGRGLGPWPIVAVGLLLWLLSGVFIVGPDERGLVLRFGDLVREVGPGPGYHLPWPLEEVIKPSVTQVRKEEFGFRTTDAGPPARYRDVDQEALMLTGDGNIIKLQFIVQYRVRPDTAGDFVFNARDPRETLRVASEAAMRQVIGNTKIDDALTEGRARVEQDTQGELQKILDGYRLGIDVDTVKLQDVAPPDAVSDAFKDVISAEQDKERLINEARGYANDVVPRARGRAAQLVNEADGYRLAKIEEARGDAERFLAMLAEYQKAPDVTRVRLYLETMQEVLPRMKKVLIDEVAGRQAVPYLPLDSFLRSEQKSAAVEPAAD
jgi:modulator of FtsH protease HflK